MTEANNQPLSTGDYIDISNITTTTMLERLLNDIRQRQPHLQPLVRNCLQDSGRVAATDYLRVDADGDIMATGRTPDPAISRIHRAEDLIDNEFHLFAGNLIDIDDLTTEAQIDQLIAAVRTQTNINPRLFFAPTFDSYIRELQYLRVDVDGDLVAYDGPRTDDHTVIPYTQFISEVTSYTLNHNNLIDISDLSTTDQVTQLLDAVRDQTNINPERRHAPFNEYTIRMLRYLRVDGDGDLVLYLSDDPRSFPIIPYTRFIPKVTTEGTMNEGYRLFVGDLIDIGDLTARAQIDQLVNAVCAQSNIAPRRRWAPVEDGTIEALQYLRVDSDGDLVSFSSTRGHRTVVPYTQFIPRVATSQSTSSPNYLRRDDVIDIKDLTTVEQVQILIDRVRERTNINPRTWFAPDTNAAVREADFLRVNCDGDLMTLPSDVRPEDGSKVVHYTAYMERVDSGQTSTHEDQAAQNTVQRALNHLARTDVDYRGILGRLAADDPALFNHIMDRYAVSSDRV